MLHPVWNPFSRYADHLEKKVDKLLWRVSFANLFETQRKVLTLMQENLVIVNLWLEARFKGYKYLKKSVRKRMYRHAERIGQVFLDFASKTPLDDAAVDRNLQNLGLSRPAVPDDFEKLKFITAIMLFLTPRAGRFEYLEGASFGKLLSDPDRQQKMIGDCNQIVTFYAYLFSLKYDIKDLEIKLMEKHVCLHFKGIDIEATAGAFAKYDKYLHLLPVVELIPTNLLDVSDFRDKQIKVDPHSLLKAAHLADNLSTDRQIIGENLKVAYHNVAVDALNSNDFDMAIFFAEKAGAGEPEIQKLIAAALHNAVVFHVKAHNFSKARFYLSKSNEYDLQKYVDENEAFYLFDQGSLDRARDIFARTGNDKMVKACWAKEYNKMQSRVAGLKDLASMKSHRYDYQKMLEIARKMDDYELVNNLSDLLRKL
jgi:hypothetical protein